MSDHTALVVGGTSGVGLATARRLRAGGTAVHVVGPQTLPARRIATAEDVAEVVALAAANPNLTGTVIEADGGARLVSMG